MPVYPILLSESFSTLTGRELLALVFAIIIHNTYKSPIFGMQKGGG